MMKQHSLLFITIVMGLTVMLPLFIPTSEASPEEKSEGEDAMMDTTSEGSTPPILPQQTLLSTTPPPPLPPSPQPPPNNKVVPPPWFDQITLLDAVEMAELEAVKYRVSSAGDNVTIPNNYPSDYALFQSASKDLPILEYLVEEAGVLPINPPNVLGLTPLHLGAQSCSLDLIKYGVERGVGVNYRDARGRTPLHFAAASNCVKALDYLLAKGAELNNNETETRSGGDTPLHAAAAAAHSNNIQALAFLLDRGAELEARNKKGLTPLHSAIRRQEEAVRTVRYLVARGADVRTRNGNGDTLLHTAVLEKVGLPLVQYLVEEAGGVDDSPNVRNRDGFSALELSYPEDTQVAYIDYRNGTRGELYSPDQAVHNYLLKVARQNASEFTTTTTTKATSEAPPDGIPLEYKYIALREAIESGNVDAVRFRVSMGDNVSSIVANHFNALQLACQAGAFPVVKYLVEEEGSAEVNPIRNPWHLGSASTPLHIAARLKSAELLRYLVGVGGADVNGTDRSGATALHEAASGIYLEPVKYLVEEAGADVNAKDTWRSTPLHYATSGDKFPLHIIYFLVEHGAALDGADSRGDTPLAKVVKGAGKYNRSPPVPLIKYLVGKGADLTTRNEYDGKTLLHHAASSMSPQLFKYLIQSGRLDVNAKDRSGNSPLHLVAPLHSRRRKGQLEVIRILVESGADLTAENRQGRTPCGIYQGGDAEAKRLLTPPNNESSCNSPLLSSTQKRF